VSFITPIGFLDTTEFAARFVLQYREHMRSGILELRSAEGDLPILAKWKTAASLLKRLRNEASILLKSRAELGKAWLETVPGGHGTPWSIDEDEYAQGHLRTRTCIIAAPDAYTHVGTEQVILGPGIVNIVEHKVLHSETNLGSFPRTHLIVDVKVPEQENEDGT
jgi:hypothetical protein